MDVEGSRSRGQLGEKKGKGRIKGMHAFVESRRRRGELIVLGTACVAGLRLRFGTFLL